VREARHQHLFAGPGARSWTLVQGPAITDPSLAGIDESPDNACAALAEQVLRRFTLNR